LTFSPVSPFRHFSFAILQLHYGLRFRHYYCWLSLFSATFAITLMQLFAKATPDIRH
jgi:hypothetical protein